MKTIIRSKCGDRLTSDVVVRLRTNNGRDDWMYCHSHILVESSKYFADRLSDRWPTCQIIDSRNCVEVYCEESDFDYHVTVLRLLYYVNITKLPPSEMWNGVKNALCILRVAMELGCPHIVAACVNYMESVPWEEAEEEEILKVIPRMDSSQADPILARLRPVNSMAIVKIFISAVQFATSSPSLLMNDLKISAQEQLEYMLTEDDDAPLLIANGTIKVHVRECIKRLLARFNNLIQTLLCGSPDLDGGAITSFHSYLGDLSWICQILAKLEMMKEVVNGWIVVSENTVQVVEKMMSYEAKLTVVEVIAKVLEAIGDGTVILPTVERLRMVKIWLPFVRRLKPLFDCSITNDDEGQSHKMEVEVWQTLESTLVSIILALPSWDQAEILMGWLRDEHIRYPDLTEVFEVWCYRTKVANKRLA